MGKIDLGEARLVTPGHSAHRQNTEDYMPQSPGSSPTMMALPKLSSFSPSHLPYLQDQS